MSNPKFSQLPVLDGSAYDATRNYSVAVVAGVATLIPIGDLGGMNEQVGTTYTLTLGDAFKQGVNCTNAAAINLTLPAHSAVPIPVGTKIPISQGGAGVVTIVADVANGVTLRAPNGAATIAQYDARVAEKIANNVWRLW
jgi:hypothetical protein